MTLSKAKADAYEKMEDAIATFIAAFAKDGDKTGWMTTGWLLVTNEIRLPTPEELEEEPDADELDYKYISGAFTRRGQEPIIGYGLANEYIRRYNSVNE